MTERDPDPTVDDVPLPDAGEPDDAETAEPRDDEIPEENR